MAILKGKDGTVTLAGTLQNGGAGTSLVSSWNVSIETDTLETTAMGTGGWKTFEGSLQSWNGTVELYFKDDDASLVSASPDYNSGAAVAVILTDGTSGNTYTGSAIVTSSSVEVSSADLVTMSLDLTGTGELTIT
jgi:predicted secreted protein